VLDRGGRDQGIWPGVRYHIRGTLDPSVQAARKPLQVLAPTAPRLNRAAPFPFPSSLYASFRLMSAHMLLRTQPPVPSRSPRFNSRLARSVVGKFSKATDKKVTGPRASLGCPWTDQRTNRSRFHFEVSRDSRDATPLHGNAAKAVFGGDDQCDGSAAGARHQRWPCVGW